MVERREEVARDGGRGEVELAAARCGVVERVGEGTTGWEGARMGEYVNFTPPLSFPGVPLYELGAAIGEGSNGTVHLGQSGPRHRGGTASWKEPPPSRRPPKPEKPAESDRPVEDRKNNPNLAVKVVRKGQAKMERVMWEASSLSLTHPPLHSRPRAILLPSSLVSLPWPSSLA